MAASPERMPGSSLPSAESAKKEIVFFDYAPGQIWSGEVSVHITDRTESGRLKVAISDPKKGDDSQEQIFSAEQLREFLDKNQCTLTTQEESERIENPENAVSEKSGTVIPFDKPAPEGLAEANAAEQRAREYRVLHEKMAQIHEKIYQKLKAAGALVDPDRMEGDIEAIEQRINTIGAAIETLVEETVDTTSEVTLEQLEAKKERLKQLEGQLGEAESLFAEIKEAVDALPPLQAATENEPGEGNASLNPGSTESEGGDRKKKRKLRKGGSGGDGGDGEGPDEEKEKRQKKKKEDRAAKRAEKRAAGEGGAPSDATQEAWRQTTQAFRPDSREARSAETGPQADAAERKGPDAPQDKEKPKGPEGPKEFLAVLAEREALVLGLIDNIQSLQDLAGLRHGMYVTESRTPRKRFFNPASIESEIKRSMTEEEKKALYELEVKLENATRMKWKPLFRKKENAYYASEKQKIDAAKDVVSLEKIAQHLEQPFNTEDFSLSEDDFQQLSNSDQAFILERHGDVVGELREELDKKRTQLKGSELPEGGEVSSRMRGRGGAGVGGQRGRQGVDNRKGEAAVEDQAKEVRKALLEEGEQLYYRDEKGALCTVERKGNLYGYSIEGDTEPADIRYTESQMKALIADWVKVEQGSEPVVPGEPAQPENPAATTPPKDTSPEAEAQPAWTKKRLWEAVSEGQGFILKSPGGKEYVYRREGNDVTAGKAHTVVTEQALKRLNNGWVFELVSSIPEPAVKNDEIDKASPENEDAEMARAWDEALRESRELAATPEPAWNFERLKAEIPDGSSFELRSTEATLETFFCRRKGEDFLNWRGKVVTDQILERLNEGWELTFQEISRPEVKTEPLDIDLDALEKEDRGTFRSFEIDVPAQPEQPLSPDSPEALQQKIDALKTDMEEFRYKYAETDYEHTSAWKTVTGFFRNLTKKGDDDADARYWDSEYKKKLMELKNLELDQLKQSGLKGEALKERMAGLIQYYKYEQASGLYNDRTQVRMERKTLPGKIFDLYEAGIKKYSKLPRSVKVALSLGLLGLSGVTGGTSLVVKRILAGSGAAVGIESVLALRSEEKSKKLKEEHLKQFKKGFSVEKYEEAFKEFSSLLNLEIEGLNDDLQKKKREALLRKGAAWGIGVGIVGASYAASGLGHHETMNHPSVATPTPEHAASAPAGVSAGETPSGVHPQEFKVSFGREDITSADGKRGLWGVLDRHLPQDMLPQAEKDRIIRSWENIIQQKLDHMSPAERAAVGFPTGNINNIYADTQIDLGKLLTPDEIQSVMEGKEIPAPSGNLESVVSHGAEQGDHAPQAAHPPVSEPGGKSLPVEGSGKPLPIEGSGKPKPVFDAFHHGSPPKIEHVAGAPVAENTVPTSDYRTYLREHPGDISRYYSALGKVREGIFAFPAGEHGVPSQYDYRIHAGKLDNTQVSAVLEDMKNFREGVSQYDPIRNPLDPDHQMTAVVKFVEASEKAFGKDLAKIQDGETINHYTRRMAAAALSTGKEIKGFYKP